MTVVETEAANVEEAGNEEWEVITRDSIRGKDRILAMILPSIEKIEGTQRELRAMRMRVCDALANSGRDIATVLFLHADRIGVGTAPQAQDLINDLLRESEGATTERVRRLFSAWLSDMASLAARHTED